MCPSNRFPANYLSLQGLRLLVVDNNVDCCDLITCFLQPYGVEVRTAYLARQALEIFEKWQPDILVSDIALPEEDGYDLIRQVRAKIGRQEEVLLAIAVTGYVNEKMLQDALFSGFDLWFTKPLNLQSFVATLSCWANSRPFVTV